MADMCGDGWRIVQDEALLVIEFPLSFSGVQAILSDYGLDASRLEVAIELAERTHKVFEAQLRDELCYQAMKLKEEEG